MSRHYTNPWDQRYDRDDYVYGEAPNDFLRSVSERLPDGGSVLCLADGEGRNGVFLAERGHRVTSVDASAVGLRKARDLAERRTVAIDTVVADLAEYPIAATPWDAVVSIFCHLPPHLRNMVHRHVVAALQPGGWFVLEAYRPAQLVLGTGGPPRAELMMELKTVREELAGLDLVIAREVDREINEGTLHSGPSAVIQVLARKPVTDEAATSGTR